MFFKSLLALNEANQKLEAVYGENMIDMIGAESSHAVVKDCPDLLVKLSGINFNNTETNNDYGIARLVFDSKTKAYTFNKQKFIGKLKEQK